MHKAVVTAEMKETPGGLAAAGSAFDQMRRLMHDPAMGWIQPLTDLLVALDQRIADDEPLTEAEARGIREDVEVMVGPSKPTERHGFQRGLATLIPDHPQIAMALGDVRRALAKLPEPGEEREGR